MGGGISPGRESAEGKETSHPVGIQDTVPLEIKEKFDFASPTAPHNHEAASGAS